MPPFSRPFRKCLRRSSVAGLLPPVIFCPYPYLVAGLTVSAGRGKRQVVAGDDLTVTGDASLVLCV